MTGERTNAGNAGGLSTFVATGFYSGYFRPYPALWGSFAAAVTAFALASTGFPLPPMAGVLAVLSVWSSSAVERRFGHDARRVVIDEWAGMFVALAWIPVGVLEFLSAFLLFRIFDTWKLPPANWAERAPSGWGVTLDDLVAGGQTYLAIECLRMVGRAFS